MSRIETRESAVIFIYQSTFKDISYEEQLDQYIALNEELLLRTLPPELSLKSRSLMISSPSSL